MTVLISDTFTATNGTAISGRTPDVTVSSRTWHAGNWLGGTVGTIDIQNNKARMTASDNGFSIDAGQTDYKVTWYCTKPASGQFRGGCKFRSTINVDSITGSNANYYFVTIRFDLGTANIRFIKTTNNVETTIGTDVTMSFSANTTYKMELLIKGNTFTLFIDGVQKKQETDSSFTTGTIIGFSAGAVSGNDFTFDSIQVETEVVSASSSKTLSSSTASSSATNLVSSSLSKTLSDISKSIGGNISISGNVSKSLSATTASSTATNLVVSALNKILSDVSLVSAGTVTSNTVTGSLNKTLSDYILSSAGNASLFGNTNAILGSLSIVSLGNVPIYASLLNTLLNNQLASNGDVFLEAILNGALADLVLSSSSNIIISSFLNSVLQSNSVQSSGNVFFPIITGSLSGSINSISINSGGNIFVSALLDRILSGMSRDAVGSLLILGGLDKALSNQLLTSDGMVRDEIVGGLNAVLDGLGYTIRGVVFTSPQYTSVAFVTRKLETSTNMVKKREDNLFIVKKQESQEDLGN